MSEAAAKHQKTNNGLVAAAFAVWAAVLLVAFFSYRGSDVGQLQNLIGNLGGGQLVANEGLTASFIGVVVAGFIYQSWVGTGVFVYRLLGIEIRSVSLLLAVVTSIGAAVWSLIWFLLGLAGAYYFSVSVAAVVIGSILILVPIRRPVLNEGFAFNVWRQLSVTEWSIIILIGFVLLLSFIAAIAPPIAKDTLLYHFALPKAYVAQHSNAIVEGNISSYLALGSEMHNVWAMLLGGLSSTRAAEAAAGVTSFLFFPILLLATYGWARELELDRRWALMAALVIASVPTAFHVASSAYVDLSLALYVTLAIYALSRWWRDQRRSSLVLIGIVLGAALSIKLTSVFIFAAVALVVLLRARKDKQRANRIIAEGFAALLLACAIASPWYLRTWAATGSPVFPFYMSIWKGQAAGWDVERSNLFQAMNSQYGGAEKGVVDYVLAPFNLSVVAQPEQVPYFDGVVGVAFLIGLPILIWGLWKFELPIEVKIGLGVAGVMFLFWLFSSQQLRYLLPVLPILSVGIVATVKVAADKNRALRSVSCLSFAAASLAAVLVCISWFLEIAPVRVVLGGESRDQYLARNLDYYPYYQWLNTQTAADSKVWLINMRRDTYDLDRPVFSDYLFEDWTLRKMIWESQNVKELRTKTAAMGIQYVMTRHDFLFDYGRSTIVDDKKGRDENEAKLRIAKDFILDPANTVRSDNKFSLIKVY